MSYCEHCRHEYADTVEFCVDCGRRLKRGRRPVQLPLDTSDFFVPAGAFICALVAMLLIYLRVAAQMGWISGSFAQMIVATQPPCLTVFYAVALLASVLVFAWWTINTLIFRR